MGRLGQIQVGMGLPLFFQKLLQDGFGIDPNEFIAKNVPSAERGAATKLRATRCHPLQPSLAERASLCGRRSGYCGVAGDVRPTLLAGLLGLRCLLLVSAMGAAVGEHLFVLLLLGVIQHGFDL